MGMSDCVKCWDTPCGCGWDYQGWSVKARVELAASVLGVSIAEVMSALVIPEVHPIKQNPSWSCSQPPADEERLTTIARRLVEFARWSEGIFDEYAKLKPDSEDAATVEDETEASIAEDATYLAEYLQFLGVSAENQDVQVLRDQLRKLAVGYRKEGLSDVVS